MKIKKIVMLVVFDIIILVLSSFLCSYLSQKFEISDPIYLVFGVVLFLLLGLFNGIFIGKKGFLVGFLSGCFICLILTMILVLGLEKDISIMKFFIYVLSSSLGGSLGKNLRKKK